MSVLQDFSAQRLIYTERFSSKHGVGCFSTVGCLKRKLMSCGCRYVSTGEGCFPSKKKNPRFIRLFGKFQLATVGIRKLQGTEPCLVQATPQRVIAQDGSTKQTNAKIQPLLCKGDENPRTCCFLEAYQGSSSCLFMFSWLKSIILSSGNPVLESQTHIFQ